MPSENSPLLPPSNASGSESSKYYFLNRNNSTGGTTDAVRDGDGAPVHEILPPGATPEEFAPRIIGSPAVVCIVIDIHGELLVLLFMCFVGLSSCHGIDK